MRALLVVACIAVAAAKNCGGSLAVNPRYCSKRKPNNGGLYCNNENILVGDTVPLRVQAQNKASYEDSAANDIFVDGTLKEGAYIQIVFVCNDGVNCESAAGDVLTYTGQFDDDLDGEGSETFEMGPAPAGYGGVNKCQDWPNSETACGHIRIGANVPITGNEIKNVGHIYMRAAKFKSEAFFVHVAGDSGLFETTGNICAPNELTASGTGTASGGFATQLPPPPPIPDKRYACIIHSRCWNCESLPPNACLYYGDPYAECIDNCDDLPPEWVFPKAWGQCSSMCPVSATKDPHLHLPHGGRADFRGKDKTVFNLLTAKDVTFNVLFEAADFAWATRLVHGTKMDAAYWVLRTASGKRISVEFEAHKYGNLATVHEEEHQDVLVRPDQPALVVDDVEIVMLSHKTLSVSTSKWRFMATSSSFPFGKLAVNKDKVLLDVAIQPRYNVDSDVVAPHGIVGQSYDGDAIAVDGKLDSDKSGESTTVAQAEGAIEGTWEDYIMASPFATDYKYSRFDATAAPRRDVSKLSGSKKAATTGVDSTLSGAISINLATAAATALEMATDPAAAPAPAEAAPSTNQPEAPKQASPARGGSSSTTASKPASRIEVQVQ